MWVFLLAVLLSASPVLSFTPDESAEIGSCRFDKTSVAVFSCVQPGGKWRPPSMACCSALLYAIDRLPASGESGACCLCRYTTVKYSSAGLVASYVLCQGKDRHIVTTWSVPITSCLGVCTRRKDSSHGMGTPAQKDRPLVHVHGSGSNIFEILWWIVAAAALCCVILLICFGYFWWFKPPTNARESQSLPLNIQMQVQHRGLSLGDDPRAERRRSSGRRSPVQLMERRRSSGQRSPVQLKERRMSSSRASPNG